MPDSNLLSRTAVNVKLLFVGYQVTGESTESGGDSYAVLNWISKARHGASRTNRLIDSYRTWQVVSRAENQYSQCSRERLLYLVLYAKMRWGPGAGAGGGNSVLDTCRGVTRFIPKSSLSVPALGAVLSQGKGITHLVGS